MDDDCEPESIEDVLDCVEEAAADEERVSIADIMAGIGDGAFAPMLLLPALIMLSPATAIFGVASFCGLLIVLIATQMLLGRERLWLPAFVLDRTISRSRLNGIVEWVSKPARFVDRLAQKRLSFLVEPPLTRVWALLCLLLALIAPVFELVPMSATIIGAAISLFALALVSRDGLFALIGLAVLGGAAWLVWSAAT